MVPRNCDPRRPISRPAGLLLCLLTACPLLATDGLTPEIAVSLRAVSDARPDPAGRYVAYVRSVPRSADDEPGAAYSEIHLVEIANGETRRFTRPGVRSWSPRWSPDGTRLAFLSKRGEDAETQLYVIPVDGGEAVPTIEPEAGIDGFAWSPDGRSIAFTTRDPQTDAEREAEEAGRDWRIADEGLRHVRLWLHDLDAGTSRALYDGDLSTWDFAWAPDGGGLVLCASHSPRTDDAMMYSELMFVSVEGGKPETICKTAGKLGDFAVSPDGKTLAFLGATSLNDPLPQSLFSVPLEGGEPTNLTPELEASAARLAWADNRNIAILLDQGTGTALARIELESRNREQTPFVPIVERLVLGPDGLVVAVANTPTHLSEVYVAGTLGAPLRRLTRHNPELDDVRLGRRETTRWPSVDGWEIDGVVTYPPGYNAGQPYPLIVRPHGGPEGVSQCGWDAMAQLLAARGFVVLQPNYRGSGGRGVAFSKGDQNDLGGREFQDVLTGIAALAEQGIADAERVGIGGWSYGGYMSALAATHHAEHFDAAIMGAGISNWLSFMGTTDIPHEMSIVHWNQWGYDDPAAYWATSPLSGLSRSSVPTLILHGAHDERVPPSQAWELYRGLKARGVATDLVLYPRSGHGVNERAHLLDLYERQLAWFEQYVK